MQPRCFARASAHLQNAVRSHVFEFFQAYQKQPVLRGQLQKYRLSSVCPNIFFPILASDHHSLLRPPSVHPAVAFFFYPTCELVRPSFRSRPLTSLSIGRRGCLDCLVSCGRAVQLLADCLRRSTNRNQSNCWRPHQGLPPRTDWASVRWISCDLENLPCLLLLGVTLKPSEKGKQSAPLFLPPKPHSLLWTGHGRENWATFMVGDGWHSSNQSREWIWLLIVCQLVTTGIFVRLSEVLPVPCCPPLKAAPASRNSFIPAATATGFFLWHQFSFFFSLKSLHKFLSLLDWFNSNLHNWSALVDFVLTFFCFVVVL